MFTYIMLLLAVVILILFISFKLYEIISNNVLNFKDKSVLFFGPADVDSAQNCNTLDYDYVILPNNMCRVFDKPYNNLIIMTNDYFAKTNSECIINKNPAGILCTTKSSYIFMKNKLNEKNIYIPIRRCPFPTEWPRTSYPLGLSFLLQYMITYAPLLKRLDVIGVTFYDNGQEYRRGYKLIEMGKQHNVENDKKYAREIIKKHKNIKIKYPL